MDIKLGYIEGISNIDTPYFSNISAQNDFFTNHQVTSISTTFYPPHYRNRIRFDVEDIDFTSQINYLWFEYNSKVYYYFIDDIEYINENTIELPVTMDVIQTFMFNINFSNVIIERKFINRWVNAVSDDFSINRRYIRENVSDGLFDHQYTELFKPDTWLVVKVTEPDRGLSNQHYGCEIKIDDSIITLPYVFYVFPLSCNKISYMKQQSVINNFVRTDEDITFTDIKDLLSYPGAVDAYVVKDNPFPNIISTVTSGNNTIMYISDDYVCPSNGRQLSSNRTKCIIKTGCGVCVFQDSSDTNSDLYIDTYKQSIGSLINVDVEGLGISLSKNTEIGVSFGGSSFMPVLVDENYQRVEYGDGGGVTTYPISRIWSPTTVKYTRYLNIDDGSYTYTISDGLGDSLYDGLSFETYCLSNITLNMPLYNDAWKDYVANNRGRWIAAGMGAVKNALEYFGPIAMRGAKINKAINSTLSKSSSYDKRFKKLTLKSSTIDKINALEDSRSQASDFDIGDMPITRQIVSDYNAFMRPDSIRQSGDGASGFISSQAFTRFRLLYVNDIEQCANYFHRNGYKVDQYLSSVPHPFDYIQNRYYFNIIKVSDVDLHLRDYIENDALLDNITNRLKDGFRLWNVMNQGVNIGNFSYDNVELDYLE